MKTPALIALAQATASTHNVPSEVVCAIVEQESDWNEFAVRYEPRFMSKYVSPIFLKGEITPTEAYTRSMSWGLMQIMGQVAREQGFTGHFLAELCDPFNNLTQGCIKLRHCLDRTKGDINAALLRYNGGGNPDYPAQVLARVANYKEIT